LSINSLIKPELFYSHRKKKTKLNWFCYEIALSFEFEICHDKNLARKLEKKGIQRKDVSEFCVYTAKLMIPMIEDKLAKKIDNIFFSYEMVESYFESFSAKLINKILKALAEAWDKQLESCSTCPTRCISEKDKYCNMFDSDLYQDIDL